MYRAALDTATVFVEVEVDHKFRQSLKLSRTGLCLPQACRQIMETALLVNNYTVFQLEGSSKWSIWIDCFGGFQSALFNHGQTFSAVRELQVAPGMVQPMRRHFNLPSIDGMPRNHLAKLSQHVFRSLKRLIVPETCEQDRDVFVFQCIFGELDLEIMYEN